MREVRTAQPPWLGSGEGEVHNASCLPSPSHRDHTSLRKGTPAPTRRASPGVEPWPGRSRLCVTPRHPLCPGLPFSHQTALSHLGFNSKVLFLTRNTDVSILK